MVTLRFSKQTLFIALGSIAMSIGILIGMLPVAAAPKPIVNTSTLPYASNVPTENDYTLASLTTFAKSDPTYKDYTFDQWDMLIQQLGISHIDDTILQTTLNNMIGEINQDNTQLSGLVVPSDEQIVSINSQVADL